jgi:hypothetical protein
VSDIYATHPDLWAISAAELQHLASAMSEVAHPPLDPTRASAEELDAVYAELDVTA